MVEFCTLFIINTNNNNFKGCIAKPKPSVLFFNLNFVSWLVYYLFVCALFVINWIKWTIMFVFLFHLLLLISAVLGREVGTHWTTGEDLLGWHRVNEMTEISSASYLHF